MNEIEAQRIAAAINQMRPDWPIKSLLTLIHNKLMTRPRRDVAVALTWIACDSTTQTPARVIESGPWWKAANLSEGGAPRRPMSQFDCGTCSLPEDRCRSLWATDHEYTPAGRKPEKLPSDQLADVMAELRDRTRTPLEDS